MKREYGYVVTLWTNAPPRGRVWIDKDVEWSIVKKRECQIDRQLSPECQNSSVAIYVGSIWKQKWTRERGN